MAAPLSTRRIKAGITARGFHTAVKDYKEPAVIEELVANSYDADASTVVVLLDPAKQQLHIIDDGSGFSKQAIETAAVLGGGEKGEVEYSVSKRPYLGAYGFGLKSTLKVSNTVAIKTLSRVGSYGLVIDWKRLEEVLKAESDGFELQERKTARSTKTGTHIVLDLKQPTSEEMLASYHKVLSNLPDDDGKCRYYTGLLSKVRKEIAPAFADFGKLRSISRKLAKGKRLSAVDPSRDPDLRDCEKHEGKDKHDKDVSCCIYFAGFDGDKIKPLKRGLRGIYVRIQGRLLKQSFDDQKYVYGISKWIKFAHGLRVELTIDWLRNEISLSREGLTFSNSKLEEQFRTTLARNISAFISPQLKTLGRKAERHSEKRHSQRLELAKRRSKDSSSGRLKGVKGGFIYKPETDGELALLVANEEVLRRINPAYRLLDYNDQAPFDCIFYDKVRRAFVYCELEPTLMEFLQHRQTPEGLKLIVTWSLGKWRMGARKKGVKATYELVRSEPQKKGHYRLLAFNRETSKKPFRDYDVITVEDLFSVHA